MSRATRRAGPRPRGVPPDGVGAGPTMSTSSWLPAMPRWWWLVGLVGGSIGALGFQTLPPARRLERLEMVNAQQDSATRRIELRNSLRDSAFVEHLRAEQAALEQIRQRLDRLLAGRCAEVGGRLARTYYDCDSRGAGAGSGSMR